MTETWLTSEEVPATEYMRMVKAEFRKLADRGVDELDARAQAYAKISRTRPDLLELQKDHLIAVKRAEGLARRGVFSPAVVR